MFPSGLWAQHYLWVQRCATSMPGIVAPIRNASLELYWVGLWRSTPHGGPADTKHVQELAI